MKSLHLNLRRFAAVLIGIVLVGSGLLKLMDPVGTGLIVTEYFKFFHLGGLAPLARPFGVGLALLEAVLGAALVTGFARKVSAWATCILLSFFTLITLILWIFNPEMDCGCFGEAIHLTHLQSLLKNVVLLALAVFAFTPFRDFGKPSGHRRAAFFLAGASILFACVYGLTHLPLVDFTEFAPGVELFASLDNDYQAGDGYVATYIYERDGQRGSFTLDRLPDSTWTFVAVDTVYRSGMAKDASKPVLSFRDEAGEYQDELAVLGKTVVFSVYRPEKTDWERLQAQADAVSEAGATPLLLVFPRPERIPVDLPVYEADYKTLVTLNRANGGAAYFDEGELVGKWTPRDFPENLSKLFARDPVDASTDFIVSRRIKAQGFCLYLAAVLFLL